MVLCFQRWQLKRLERGSATRSHSACQQLISVYFVVRRLRLTEPRSVLDMVLPRGVSATLQCYLSTSRISEKIFCANAASPFTLQFGCGLAALCLWVK
jgi:hypothetical protein